MDRELRTGAALDEAVAQAIGEELGASYSTSWHQAGPLIDKHKITIIAHEDFGGDNWSATLGEFSHYIDASLSFAWEDRGEAGPTALVAAMRALVKCTRPN